MADYQDIEVIEDNTDKVVSAFGTAIERALEEMGIVGERFAKENLTKNESVITGRLRNSVTHAVSEGEKAVYIGTNVEYGKYVELGTRRSRAKPWLRPAAVNNGDTYRGIAKKHLKSV